MRIFLIVLFTAISFNLFSTHLRCGQIFVRQIAPGSKTVEITIEYFTNIQNTTVLMGGEDDFLDFGDGHTYRVPEVENREHPTLHLDNVRYAVFTTMHTYDHYGQYTVSYSEPNRNEGILNFAHSVTTRAYLESKITLFQDRAYKSPVSLLPPMFSLISGSDFSASVAAIDSNGFKLTYQWAIPLMDPTTPVENYVHPGVEVDPMTGLMTWDGKFQGTNTVGEYLVAIRIKQYDTLDGKWRLVGETFRDYQILQEDGDTGGSISTNLDDPIIEIPENSTRQFKVFAFHLPNENPEFALATELAPQFYSLETYDSISGEQHIRVAMLNLIRDPAIDRITPYIISLRTTFNNSLGPPHFHDLNFAVVTDRFVPQIINSAEDERTINVIPNPFHERVRVINYDQPVIIEVTNAVGQEILAKERHDGNEFEFPGLSSGMYVVRVLSQTGKLLKVSRLIKN
jgi:hypothetical protein